MRRLDPIKHFMKIYPRCGRSDIQNLVDAIRCDKYWNVHPGAKDEFYVVALTRAQFPIQGGFQARATCIGFVKVVKDAAKFCRRGRVLAVVKKDFESVAVSVVSWPAFLRLIRLDSGCIYRMLLKGALPSFIGEREVTEIGAACIGEQIRRR